MVRQLTKFQAKGSDLPHMSSTAAWTNLHSSCALEWWSSWGTEVPELQKLAMRLVPLLIGSGPAERTWKDVGNILTKNRNRLDMSTCLDLVFVRTWLRRELKVVSDEELEIFKDWEAELLLNASFYDGVVEPDDGVPTVTHRVFDDRIEDWELNAIDGTGPGARIRLSDVKKNKQARFRLQEKYKMLYFVDKDPDGSCGYYDTAEGAAAATDEWEQRKIIGLIWENRRGWRLETKLCSELTGPSANYLINESMIRMIKESSRNRLIKFRSEM